MATAEMDGRTVAVTFPEALGGQFYPLGGLRGEPALSGGAGHGTGDPGRRSIDPLVGATAWRFASRTCTLAEQPVRW